MRTSSKSELDTKVLDAIIKNLPGNVETNVAKVAFAVEVRSKVNIQTMEAIDTGALLNSNAVSMRSQSDVKRAMAAARARNPKAETVELPVPNDRFTAFVGPTVEYGEDVHNGTNRMAGRPYLLQAMRDTEKDFKAAMGKAVSNGK